MNRILVLTLALFGYAAHADIAFEDLSQEDFKKVISDFSANSLHTSVSGAGTLGDIFGFEIGLVGGITKTPEIDKLVKRAEPGTDAEQIPHAELIGLLSVPFAITGEVGFIPKVGNDDFKFGSYSLAVKWTPTELFFDWPVNLAVKAHYTSAEAEFSGDVNGVATDFDFENQVMGVTAFVSKNFAIVEPYAGIGWVSGEGDLNVTGSTQVFNATYTGSNSASEKETSTLLLVGAEFKLILVKLGVEYANVFDTDRFTGKLAFYF